jgi:hypothetical protein
MNRKSLFVFLGLVVAVAMLLPVSVAVNTHSVNSQQFATAVGSTPSRTGALVDGNGQPPPPFPNLGFDGTAPPPPFPSLSFDGTAPPPPFPSLSFEGTAPPPPFPSLSFDGTAPPPPFPSLSFDGTAPPPPFPNLALDGESALPPPSPNLWGTGVIC